MIQTERLILRAHTLADFNDSCAIWADPDVSRFTMGRPSTPDEVWARLLRYAGLWQLLGFGYFAVADRQTGAVIGDFGLADFHRDCDPPIGNTPEVGWVLLPQYHGRGFAHEALSAVLAWADEIPMPRTVCLIDPQNTASLRLAAKLGYREYALATFKDKPSILLERLAS